MIKKCKKNYHGNHGNIIKQKGQHRLIQYTHKLKKKPDIQYIIHFTENSFVFCPTLHFTLKIIGTYVKREP